MTTNLRNCGIVILLLMSGRKEKENSQVVEPPQSVLSFFEVYGGVQQAMQYVMTSVSTDPQKAEGVLKKTEIRLEELLATAKTVSTYDLNQIYPKWGDQFIAELLPATELLLKCARQTDKTYCAKASPHLRAWDDWLGMHWNPIVQRLHETYGFETQARPQQHTGSVGTP